MRELPQDYSNFHTLNQRTKEFIRKLPTLPLAERERQFLTLIAQHLDRPIAQQGLQSLKEKIADIYQNSRSESNPHKTRELSKLAKEDYWKFLSENSVWNVFSDQRFEPAIQSHFFRGWRKAEKFIESFRDAAISHSRPYDLSIIIGRFASNVGNRRNKIDTIEITITRILLKDVLKEVGLDPNSPEFSLITLKLARHVLGKRLTMFISDFITQFSYQLETRVFPADSYFAKIVGKISHFTGALMKLRREEQKILEKEYPGNEENVDKIIGTIIFIRWSNLSESERVKIRRELIQNLLDKQFETALQKIREYYTYNPELLSNYGALRLGFRTD